MAGLFKIQHLKLMWPVCQQSW